MAVDRCSWVTSSRSTPKTRAATVRWMSSPAAKAAGEAGVARQVGDGPQLDLVVVGHQQAPPGRRHERLAEPPALLGAHRDVVQVGPVRRQPPGAGHGLAERGVDPPVGGHLGGQALAVGGAELLHLAVAEQDLDDRVLAAQRLEGAGVGREPGLGLAAGREAQVLVEHGAQLLDRVDVERACRPARAWWPRAMRTRRSARRRWSAGPRGRPGCPPPPSGPAPAPAAAPCRRTARPRPPSSRASTRGARSRASTAASRTSPSAGVVEPGSVRGRRVVLRFGLEQRTHPGPWPRCRRRRPPRGTGRPGRRAGSWSIGRVEQVGGHRRVDDQTGDVDPEGQQRPHQLLGVVGHHADPVGPEPGGQGVEHAGGPPPGGRRAGGPR